MLETALGIDIIQFFERPWILDVGYLSPVQKVILKSIMGMELDTETPIAKTHAYQTTDFANEVEMFKHFTGKTEYIRDFHSDADLCVGRRSGKSTLLGAGLALYFATQYDYIPYLKTSPHATIPIISPTKEQAGEVYSAIKQMILRSPYLYQTFLSGKIEGFQDEYSEENIGLNAKLTGGQIRFNNKVVIKVMAADTSKIRGMAVPFAILDECCFFGVEGNDTKNTDKSIFEALAPALSQFQVIDGMAMVLKISSPNGQAGLMFDNYENRKDTDILHFKVPSWYANPDIGIKYLEKQKKKGMSYFNREYGAEYTASESSFLDPNSIEECIIRGAEELPPNDEYRYVAAMDYATKDDYWAFGIGHKEYITDPDSKEKVERIYIDYLTAWKGSGGAELDPSEIIPYIGAMMMKYKVHYCVSDQYAFAPLRQLFQKEGCLLKEFVVTSKSKLKFMYSLSVAVNSKTLKIVHNPLAVRHLKDLREKKTSTTIRIEHAQNSHDDLADVIGLIAYQFDKTSPIYVGTHREDDFEEAPTTKDATGKHVAFPTAQEMADHLGIAAFYDNRNEHKAKDDDGEDDDSNGGTGGFYWSF